MIRPVPKRAAAALTRSVHPAASSSALPTTTLATATTAGAKNGLAAACLGRAPVDTSRRGGTRLLNWRPSQNDGACREHRELVPSAWMLMAAIVGLLLSI